MSKYSIEHIGPMLKKARKEQGMSQRDLSLKSGVPQGHISKIENGLVDIQISSLVQLARLVGMELMLVPRGLISIVQSLTKKPTHEPRPKYQLEEEDEE